MLFNSKQKNSILTCTSAIQLTNHIYPGRMAYVLLIYYNLDYLAIIWIRGEID